MFILEDPYVSDLLLKTLEDKKYPVLENDFIKEYKDFNLNLIPKNEALASFLDTPVYTNSENSINWILENFKDADISKLIKVSKNKFDFRCAIKSIYPDFYFKKISANNIENLSFDGKAFIIKPSVGFLSLGVYKVRNEAEWENVKEKIKRETKNTESFFPKSVVDSSDFIVEEIIKGEEFAVDAYFNKEGNPVILNILKHPFLDENDVSDRGYITSKKIIQENLKIFEEALRKIGTALNIKNFPLHIELIKTKGGKVIPVEINPARFAGWCTTDLGYFAYGINVYEYYFENKKPDWNNILKDINDEIFYFAIAEKPASIDGSKVKFDYEKLSENLTNILELRKINFCDKPVFAILFGKTEKMDEINTILRLNMKNFISPC